MTRKQRLETILLTLPRIRTDFKDLQAFIQSPDEQRFLQQSMLPGSADYHASIANEIIHANSLWELSDDAVVALECYMIDLHRAIECDDTEPALSHYLCSHESRLPL